MLIVVSQHIIDQLHNKSSQSAFYPSNKMADVSGSFFFKNKRIANVTFKNFSF